MELLWTAAGQVVAGCDREAVRGSICSVDVDGADGSLTRYPKRATAWVKRDIHGVRIDCRHYPRASREWSNGPEAPID